MWACGHVAMNCELLVTFRLMPRQISRIARKKKKQCSLLPSKNKVSRSFMTMAQLDAKGSILKLLVGAVPDNGQYRQVTFQLAHHTWT